MSRMSRPVLLLVIVVAGLVGIPRGAASASFAAQDGNVLGIASMRLGHQSMGRVLGWLRHQPSVRSALRGDDGRTVDIRFRDGSRAAILPSTFSRVRLPLALLRPHLQLLSRQGAPAGAARAVVMEPFATQLGLGPQAGDAEVGDLQSAGYSVDQLYDTQVTLKALTTLSQYNVAYMQTHAGVVTGGEGIVASGVKEGTDPNVGPLIRSGTVILIGVSGTSQKYYGITSSFITQYEGQFPAHSLVFLNGCNLLSAPRFWNALSAKGAGVLVSWDREATSTDNFIAGATFFKYMDNPGTTVVSAIGAVHAAGFGTSLVEGAVANLGSTGDGTVTLGNAAAAPEKTPQPGTPTPGLPVATGQPTNSGPTPTALVLRTPIPPTATSVAQPTATRTVSGTVQPLATSTASGTPQPTVTGTVPATAQPLATGTMSGTLQTTVTGTVPATTQPTATGTLPPGPQQSPTANPTPGGITTPATVSLHLKQKVAPRSQQIVTLTSSANTVLHIRVTYPNGDHQSAHMTTNAAGKVVYRYKQGASKITHTNATATITVTIDHGATASKSYTILFNHIDVSVEPRVQSPGHKVTIWVHSSAHMAIVTSLLFPNHTSLQRKAKTGPKGWSYMTYVVAKHKTVGKNHKVIVEGQTMAKKPHYSTKTTFTAA